MQMVVVVISGLPCAGSTTVGKLLAKRLKINFFSVGKLEKTEAVSMFHAKPSEATTKFLKEGFGKKREFHKKLEEAQREVAKQGDVVIEGKLSIWCIDGLADLKVWLKADFITRAKRLSERENMKIEEAKQILKEKEETEKEIWKKIYNFNYKSQEKNADLVIDTTELSPQEIVNMVLRRL